MTHDYTIRAKPRISLDTFAAVLREARSPAAGAAASAYRSAVAYGVDPAVLLAVFQHESGYGRAGVATRTRSWGNLRTSPLYPSRNGWVWYPSWAEGARDTARLLDVYGRNRIRPGRDTSTARKFPYVWAPTADGNAPASYGAAIVAAVDRYIARDRARPTPAPRPRQATAATHTCTLPRSRIRSGPNLSAAIVGHAGRGTRVRVEGTVGGSWYTVGGRRSNRWHRIVARGGRRLARPVYSAALLWRAGR